MKKNLLLLGLTVLFVSQQNECIASDFDSIPKMTIKGEASIFKPADQMEVNLGVLTSGEDPSKATEVNNKKIEQIITNLKTLGLDEADYKTGHYHVEPIYLKPAKDSESDPRKISHYEAFNSIRIKTQKIALADQIFKAAVEGGANKIGEIDFNLNNPQAYRGEAIKLAAHNALSDASNLAAATDVKIKRILDLSLDNWQNNPRPYLMAKSVQSRSYQSDLASTQVIEPGESEIHVTVNMIVEIGQ